MRTFNIVSKKHLTSYSYNSFGQSHLSSDSFLLIQSQKTDSYFIFYWFNLKG